VQTLKREIPENAIQTGKYNPHFLKYISGIMSLARRFENIGKSQDSAQLQKV
jgi:hypothetical protein